VQFALPIRKQSLPIRGVDVNELVLREQGDPQPVSSLEYQAWAPILEVLQAHKILRVRATENAVLVSANQFAGVARSPVGVVRINARHPSVVRLLRNLLVSSRRAVNSDAYSPGQVEKYGRDLTSAFLRALDDLLFVGLPFRYETSVRASSTVDGTINMDRTVAEYIAYGIHHIAVVQRSIRIAHESLCQVITAVVAALQDSDLLTMPELAMLDLKLNIFPKTDQQLSLSDAATLVKYVAVEFEANPEVSLVCEIASLILAGEDLATDVAYEHGPISFRFTDTNSLWEVAVQAYMRAAAVKVNLRSELHPYRNSVMNLFPDGGPNIDPDGVIYSATTPAAVFDAKSYGSGGADPDGVYQVVSYSRRLGVTRAALLYLVEGTGWSATFGDADVRIYAFGIPTSPDATLIQSLAAACNEFCEVTKRQD
jgi:hypothetical protein